MTRKDEFWNRYPLWVSDAATVVIIAVLVVAEAWVCHLAGLSRGFPIGIALVPVYTGGKGIVKGHR
jgi:hypothetical protein